MPSYPVTYEADYDEDRSRLHTFFRFLTIIPVAIVVYVLGLGLIVTLPIAWIAMVITGRYVPALYGYHLGLLRAVTRIGGYGALLTDSYPPFDLGERPDYPVRVAAGPPLPEYSRLLALVRLILYIPIYVIAYLLLIVAGLTSIVAWFVIVITGRQLPALQSAINMGHAFQTRATAYLLLITEQWPPLGDIDMQLEPRATGGSLGDASAPGALSAP
jgi:hypothetical protein